MVCSLAAAALLTAVPVFAQQPYGAGARPRPVSTFATPYPSTPTPGPVRTWSEAQPEMMVQPAVAVQPRMNVDAPQTGVRQATYSRPGGAAAPGAAGKVMYYFKPADSLIPDGMPDPGAVALARADVPIVSTGVPDVAIPTPGLLPPTPAPTAVIERPIAEPTVAPVLPPQPFVPSPVPLLPVEPTATKRVAPEPPPPAKTLPPEATSIPTRAAIFQMHDDATLQKAIIKSIAERNMQTPETLEKQTPFPALKPTVHPGTSYQAKTANLPPGQVVFEPGFVIHHRLHFEEKNSERYGWDLGFIQPFVSTAAFYKNMLLWPSSLASGAVVGFWDTNAGKCLPGSPTPYYLYPPGLTITGGVAEGLVITGLAFVIP